MTRPVTMARDLVPCTGVYGGKPCRNRVNVHRSRRSHRKLCERCTKREDVRARKAAGPSYDAIVAGLRAKLDPGCAMDDDGRLKR